MSEGEREGEFRLTEASCCCGATACPLGNSKGRRKFWWSPQQRGGQLGKAEGQAFVAVAAASRIRALELGFAAKAWLWS